MTSLEAENYVFNLDPYYDKFIPETVLNSQNDDFRFAKKRWQTQNITILCPQNDIFTPTKCCLNTHKMKSLNPKMTSLH